ncbi:site-specific integrase [Verrucosispora sp. ts21]|uniref:site-specific integrase n=1 Tax=Verrucosispora sp. ts21 TaxID=2069341 RepID=UPI0033655981
MPCVRRRSRARSPATSAPAYPGPDALNSSPPTKPASSSRPGADADFHALFELALHTGLRKGALLGLLWEDLDLDRGTAAVRRTLQRTNTAGLTTLPTKTRASECRIALPARCLQSLKHHHEEQQRERQTAGTEWQHNGYVFTTPQGRPIDPTNLTRTFTTPLRRADLRRIRFHDVRHSTTTLLLEQGVELVVIKELLGHAHRRHRHLYAHVRLRLQRRHPEHRP